HAVYAPHGAERRAVLHAVILAAQVVGAVLLQWDTRMTALLRAPVDQAILADIEVPRAGAAEPVVWLSVGKVLLEAVVVREVEHRLSERQDPLQNQPLRLVELEQPAASIMNDPDSGRESEIARAFGDGQGVIGIRDPAADDRVDEHVELGGLGQRHELL